MTDDPKDRLTKLRDDMAVKARHLFEISRRVDGNGFISAEDAEAAQVAAGIKPPQIPPTPEVKLARLEAAERHGLTMEQVARMTATTDAEAELEARSLTPPGDGGPRGGPVGPGDPLAEQIREAEQAGDFETAMSLKSQQLLDRASAEAQRAHPNAPR